MPDTCQAVERTMQEFAQTRASFVVRDGNHGAPARDRAWFKSNPSRAYRLRLVEPDEGVTPPSDCRAVIVRRMGADGRSRMFTGMPLDTVQDDNDALLAMAWHEVNSPAGVSLGALRMMASYAGKVVTQ